MNQASKQVIYQTDSSSGGWKILIWLIGSVFALPSIALVLFTCHELGEMPWLAIFYVVSLFPLAVLLVLYRLMTRYRLRFFSDGEAEIVFPFSTVRLDRNNLAQIMIKRHFQPTTNSHREWIHFIDKSGKTITSLAPMAFSPAEIEQFFAMIRQHRPDVTILR